MFITAASLSYLFAVVVRSRRSDYEEIVFLISSFHILGYRSCSLSALLLSSSSFPTPNALFCFSSFLPPLTLSHSLASIPVWLSYREREGQVENVHPLLYNKRYIHNYKVFSVTKDKENTKSLVYDSPVFTHSLQVCTRRVLVATPSWSR